MTNKTQAETGPQSSRRGFLRVLASLAPAVGFAGVPAVAAALEEGPTGDPALLPSGPRAVEINPAMLAIGRRAVELEEEYKLASKALSDARQTFSDLCGPVPKAIRIKNGDVTLIAGSQHLNFMSTAWLRKIVANKPAKSSEGRRLRRKLKIAEAYDARREAAERASGIRAAEERFAAVDAQIEALVEDAFRHEPRPLVRLLAIERCFTTAHDQNEPLPQVIRRIIDRDAEEEIDEIRKLVVADREASS
jgi:hypothetical protein